MINLCCFKPKVWSFATAVTGNYYRCVTSPSQSGRKILKKDKAVCGPHVNPRLNAPELKTYVYTKTCTQTFTAASFLIAEE